MNITDNLIRIKEGKDNIIKSLKNKGVSIADNTLINEIPTIIDNAEIGGGGDTPVQPEIPELVQKYEGASVFRINVPTDNYEFAINLCNDATKATYDVDWGDGSLESGLTTDEQHHTYTKKGIYDVNVYNLSKDITLGGGTIISGTNSTSSSPDDINNVICSFLFNNSNNDTWTFRYYIQNDCNITDILLGDNIIALGKYTFVDYKTLKSIKLTNSITKIPQHTFLRCTSLQSIEIPNSVTSIEQYAFYGCTSLQSIEIPEGVTTIDYYTFQYCTSLQSIEIPNSVTSIKKYAFYGCTSLQSIEIPEGVTTIDYYTFYNCTSLQSIEIPEGVTTIGDYAFQYCTSLQSIEIPEGVTTIGDYAFGYCFNLRKVILPTTINIINRSLFAQTEFITTIICKRLEAPTFSGYSTPFGQYFKGNCKYLYVPKDSVGYDSGKWKTYLIDKGWEIRYIENMETEKTPTTLKLKTKNNFFNNIQAIEGANLIDYELIDNEYNYHFDDKITELINYTFYNKVLEEIELPEGLECLGYACLSGSNIKSFKIPNSITSIGTNAFYSCTSLKSIEIPEGVTTIGDYAFQYCSYLSTITCKAMTAPTVGNSVFYSVGQNISSSQRKLRVPEGSDYSTWLSQLSGFTIEYIPLSEL